MSMLIIRTTKCVDSSYCAISCIQSFDQAFLFSDFMLDPSIKLE